MEKLTKGLEKYLYIIYSLSKEEKISPKKIGKITKNNPASVLEFIKKLQEYKLIEYKPYKGINLTVSGKNYALKIEEKREIISKFLNKFLLLEGEELQKQTENLEYHIDKNLIERFEYFLNFINFCPAELPNWFDGIKNYINNGEISEKCANCIEECLNNGKKAKCKG